MLPGQEPGVKMAPVLDLYYFKLGVVLAWVGFQTFALIALLWLGSFK